MFDPQKLLDQFLGGQSKDGKGGLSPELLKGLAGGAVAGGLASVEIYAASALAIDPAAEQAYLAMLTARLKLDPGLKASVEQEIAKVRS